MKIIKRKKKGKTNLLKVGIMMLFVSVILLILIKLFKSYKTSKETFQQNSKVKSEQEYVNESDAKSTFWSEYENEGYSISFDYPYLLHKVEYEDSGEYELFFVFEENQFSKEKGVAFGVSSDGLEKEAERIKDNVSKQGGSKLIKDEKTEFNDLKSWRLEYEAEGESLENRSFFIIEKGDFVYSLSTVPEQIQRLVDSVDFTN